MALNKREQMLLVITIAVVVVALTWLVTVPLWRYWQQLGHNRITALRELEGYRQVIARAPEWQQQYDALREQLGQQTEKFEQPSDVLQKIEQVGMASGVVISQRRELPKADRGAYYELPVQCRIEATTEALVRFLYMLRTGTGFVSVEQVQVVTQGNSPALRCDLVIHALAGKSEKPKS